MERVAIYPYSKAYEPVVMHQNLIPDMEIVSLISPKGWGLSGDIITTPDSTLTIHSDFSGSLDNCTVVWFVEDNLISLPDELLYTKVKETVEKSKKIIFTRYSNKDLLKKCEMIIPSPLMVDQDRFLSNQNIFIKEKLYDINTPVIFVMGVSENTDKYAVQISLREQFMNRGYRVSSISTRRDSGILGLHPTPDFMLESTDSEEDKILKYNHFVKQIELEEQPEIIIIGIPGGIFPYNRKLHNRFGTMTFKIANALKCDCAVLCSLCVDSKREYFDEVAKGLSHKYDIDVLFHHVAAVMKDGLADQLNEYEFRLLSLDEHFVKERMKDWKRSDVYYALDEGDAYRMTEDIIDTLSNVMTMPLV